MAIPNWRTWLATLSPEEKQALMSAIGISYSTYSQWINTDRRPRPRHLQSLMRYNPALRESIEREFPGIFREETEEEKKKSTAFEQYEDIRKTYAFTAEAVSSQTIAQKIFAYMSEQLDPEETGLLMLPALCVLDDERIRRLHTLDSYGTGLWRRPHEHSYFDLGRDSLAGMAVTRRRTVLYPQAGILDHRPFAPDASKVQSAGAFPLWRRGNLAGALVVASVHSQFFAEERIEICARNTDLYALSLYDSQFYNPQHIELQAMREDIDLPETNGASGCL